MAHSIQQSTDSPEAFAGVMVHDGTTDGHGDVFGGANWSSDVRLGVRAPRPGPPVVTAAAALNVVHLIHSFPPHAGEAPGPNLGFLGAVVQVPPGMAGPLPLVDAAFASKPHGAHRDDLAGIILAQADNGRITGCAIIVLAVHVTPERHFILVSDGAGSGSEMAGSAAVALDMEAGTGCIALGVLGAKAGKLKALHLVSGAQAVEIADAGKVMDDLDGVGTGGVVEFTFDAGAIAPGAALSVMADFGRKAVWRADLVPGESFAGEEVAAKAGCRPGAAKATKWGPWKSLETEADKAAFEAARAAAGKACHGGCGGGQNCKYTETSAELLETETKRDPSDQPIYRSKVTSQGKCECQ